MKAIMIRDGNKNADYKNMTMNLSEIIKESDELGCIFASGDVMHPTVQRPSQNTICDQATQANSDKMPNPIIAIALPSNKRSQITPSTIDPILKTLQEPDPNPKRITTLSSNC